MVDVVPAPIDGLLQTLARAPHKPRHTVHAFGVYSTVVHEYMLGQGVQVMDDANLKTSLVHEELHGRIIPDAIGDVKT